MKSILNVTPYVAESFLGQPRVINTKTKEIQSSWPDSGTAVQVARDLNDSLAKQSKRQALFDRMNKKQTQPKKLRLVK